MSAIEKDREIAAKASGGTWKVHMTDYTNTPQPMVVQDNADGWNPQIAYELLYGGQNDAEHIVRLHNRQPKYDALVDAALTHRSIHDAADGLCGICDSVSALDREES